MQDALDYLLSTENAVRMFLQQNAFYTSKVETIQANIVCCDCGSRSTKPNITFGEWWIKNKKNKEIIVQANHKYLIEAFTNGLLAGSVLKIAGKAIDYYSENTTVPNEWREKFKRRLLPHRFFVGRTVHTVPVGMIIFCGLNQYINAAGRTIEELNQEVFSRLGVHGGQFEFQAFVDQSSEYRNLHSEYLAANVLNILGWSDYDRYFEDMREILL